MERVAAAGTDRRTDRTAAAKSPPSRGEAVVTAAAGMGIVCAVAAAVGAWMLMTDPDRLMWAAASDAGVLTTLIARAAAICTAAALSLAGG